VNLNGGIITDNTAIFDGGGIFNLGRVTIMEGSSISLNIADSDADGYGNGGGIFKYTGSTLVFQDQYGNPTTDPSVIDSIVYNNHLHSDARTLSNIEP
jgi:hypothetical protein